MLAIIQNAGNSTKSCEIIIRKSANVEFGAVQKCENLVNLEEGRKINVR